ncbi:MAG: DUF5652 family protein [Candidatus Zixiibacteriota bacterium]
MSPQDATEINELFGSMGIFILFIVIISILAIWDAVWKAIGMWKAARRDDILWFLLCLILNTIGILPIIYIYAIANKKEVKIEVHEKSK